MKIGKAGLDIIKVYEQGPEGGAALESYLCPARVWTLGWGHTKGVRMGQHATLAQCEQWLLDDVADAEKAVNELVGVPLTQNQFDALVSFVFNVGRGRPLGHRLGAAGFEGSTLLGILNARDYDGAAKQFKRWNKGGGAVLNGLVARRADEEALFMTGIGD